MRLVRKKNPSAAQSQVFIKALKSPFPSTVELAAQLTGPARSHDVLDRRLLGVSL